MDPQNPKTFPQKTTDKPDEYRNEKWEQTKSRVFKSNMGRFATTVGVDSDYPMADAKLISEEEYDKLYEEQPEIYSYWGKQMKPRNFVQKFLKRFCKATVEVDKKKRDKRGYVKHKKDENKAWQTLENVL